MVEQELFFIDKVAKDTFLKYFEGLRTEVAEGMEGLIQDGNSTLRDIRTFLGQSDPGMGFDAAELSTDQSNVSVQYTDIEGNTLIPLPISFLQYCTANSELKRTRCARKSQLHSLSQVWDIQC